MIDDGTNGAGRRSAPRQGRHRRHLTGTSIVGVLLVVVSVITARSLLPGTPRNWVAIHPSHTAAGAFVPVATSATAANSERGRLWLAGDVPGSADGCVALTHGPHQGRPAIPDDPFVPGEGSICSLRSTTQESPATPAYAVSGNQHIAYGVVPASARRVTVRYEKRGNLVQRMLQRTRTLNAALFGSWLGRKIQAWEAPDLDGYRITRIDAFDATGVSVASLSFHE